jgi:indolepyruvate ferredoxin oxidoreductase
LRAKDRCRVDDQAERIARRNDRRRTKFLTDYQDAHAKTYSDFVTFVRQAEAPLPGKTALTEAVARYYFKLLAVKDEYEVARLHSNGDFEPASRGVRG